MNERIRELAEQCRIEEYNQHGDLIEFGFNEEKFAELIVRECMTVTKNYTCNQGWDYSAPVALARHFGVKG